MDMFIAIRDAALTMRQKSNVYAIILSGNGKCFSTGLDVKSVAQDPNNLDKLMQKPGATDYSNLAQVSDFFF